LSKSKTSDIVISDEKAALWVEVFITYALKEVTVVIKQRLKKAKAETCLEKLALPSFLIFFILLFKRGQVKP